MSVFVSCLVDGGQDMIKYEMFILPLIYIIIKLTYLKN